MEQCAGCDGCVPAGIYTVGSMDKSYCISCYGKSNGGGVDVCYLLNHYDTMTLTNVVVTCQRLGCMQYRVLLGVMTAPVLILVAVSLWLLVTAAVPCDHV